jgi:antitoxin component of MazEF toxin-antitoxin module
MVKTITRIGNSQGVIFDATLLELTGLKAGDQVAVSVAPGGSIILTPLRKAASAEDVAATVKRTVKDYRRTLRKLA